MNKAKNTQQKIVEVAIISIQDPDLDSEDEVPVPVVKSNKKQQI